MATQSVEAEHDNGSSIDSTTEVRLPIYVTIKYNVDQLLEVSRANLLSLPLSQRPHMSRQSSLHQRLGEKAFEEDQVLTSEHTQTSQKREDVRETL
jgi:hypothetical protein